MPAYTQYGSADYRFGFQDPAAATIAASVGLKPQTLSISSEPEFTAEAKNEDGLTEAFVVADDKKTFTMSGYVTDLAAFNTTGASFTFESDFFIVTSKKRDVANNDFQKGELNGVSYPLINS